MEDNKDSNFYGGSFDDFISVTKYDLYWEIDTRINFDSKKEDFVAYLVKEKDFYSQSYVTIIPWRQLTLYSIFFLGIGLLAGWGGNNIFRRFQSLLQGTYEISENNVFIALGIPTQLVGVLGLGMYFLVIVIAFSFGIALLVDLYNPIIIRKECLAALEIFKIIKEKNLLEECVVFDSEKNQFKIRRMPTYIDKSGLRYFGASNTLNLLFPFLMISTFSSLALFGAILSLGSFNIPKMDLAIIFGLPTLMAVGFVLINGKNVINVIKVFSGIKNDLILHHMNKIIKSQLENPDYYEILLRQNTISLISRWPIIPAHFIIKVSPVISFLFGFLTIILNIALSTN